MYPFIFPWLLWGGTVWGPLSALAGFVIGFFVYQAVSKAASGLAGMIAGVLAAVIWFRSTDRAALIGIVPSDWAALFFIATVLTFAIAIPLTTYVELPVQRFLRARLGRKK